MAHQKPVLRLEGDLVEGGDEPLTPEQLVAIIEEILPDHARPMFAEHFEADFSHFETGVGRFRANAFNCQGIPSLALRRVQTQVPTFEELGLPSTLADLALSESGILLSGGSSGSGKSTTIARLIQHINENDSRRIITIEDPIEFLFTPQHSIILQREIGVDTLSFGAALKHVLRQDPDVVMVGEMRDAESFSAALSIAETGHFVLSTLHTDTAAQSVSRILNFFPPHQRDIVRFSLSVNLRGVICQRLLQGINGGLVPAVEIMVNTPLVRKLLEKDNLDKLPAAIETDPDSGMQTFNQSIHDLIVGKIISEEEGLTYSTNPAALKMMLSGINLSEGRRIVD